MKIIFIILFYSAFANAESYQTGYSIAASSSNNIYAPDGTWRLITNSSGVNNYFVPTRTITEWNAFVANKPVAISIAAGNPKSCLDIKTKNPSATDGFYSIDPTQTGTLISAYCDMTTDGGGWTLVARSISGGTTVFGWTSSTGTAADDASVYSLGVSASGLIFTQILFGSYTAGKAWGSYVYKHNVGNNFLTTYTASMYALGAPTSIVGGVSNFGMANNLGFTSATSYYYFRDCCGDAALGLLPGGWNTAYADGSPVAGYNGYLNGRQGMIMVR